MGTDFPIHAGAEAKFGFDASKHEYIFDSKVFPLHTQKTETVGRVRKHKFVITCNGQGGFSIEEISAFDEKIMRLSKLKDNGLINEKDYEEQKKKILDRI